MNFRKSVYKTLFAVSTIVVAMGMAIAPIQASAQTSALRTIGGKSYYEHKVEAGETIYGISKKFNITVDELTKANPSIADGLKAGATIYVPVKSAAGSATPAPSQRTHKVQKKETVYGICNLYGVTEAELKAANPALSKGLKSGMTLVIPQSTSQAPKAAASTESVYEVKPGDTFYSIAKNHGLTVMQLQKLNPGVMPEYIQAGQKLTVSVPSGPNAIDYNPLVATATTMPVRNDAQALNNGEEYTIVVALPFMLQNKTLTKKDKGVLDFYRGFLMAADTLNLAGKAKIRIIALDTEGSYERVKHLTTLPQVRNANVIITPDDATHIAAFEEVSSADGGPFVLNVFNTRDESWQTHPRALQGSISTPTMYLKAYDALVARAKGCRVLFLDNTAAGAKKEKADFVNFVKAALESDGIKWYDVKYSGRLTESNLSNVPLTGNYVVIPMSGSAAEFNTFAPALKAFQSKATAAGGSVKLFGYPDWVTFNGSLYNDLCEMGATIYSRFYNDNTSHGTRTLQAAFRNWFNTNWIAGVPTQAILGFDTGNFVISSLRNNKGDFNRAMPAYEGLQSAFRFLQGTPNAGAENQALYIVTFNLDKSVTKQVR